MTPHGWLLIAVFVLAVGVTIRPLGGYMAWVFSGQCTSNRFLGLFERVFFRVACVDPSSEQNWLNYAVALLIFNLAGMILLFAILILQGAMPFNPQHLGPMAPDLALNTAVSFVTNTSWQAYAGETTLSDLSQMAGITVQSFLSAATGMAVAIAMVRGFARHGSDDHRQCLGRPHSCHALRVAAYLCDWGVVSRIARCPTDPWRPGQCEHLGRGDTDHCARAGRIAGGDQAPQWRRRRLLQRQFGTSVRKSDGAHQSFEMLLIFLIGAALTNTFGRMVGDERQGWSLFGAMMVLFAVGLCVVYSAEASGNPHFAKLGIDQAAGPLQAGGNMEGKEVRFGIAGSALFANVTTASADGAVNAMHDSFTPLGGGMVMANMMLDEVIVGAPGSGLFGMLLFALVAVFVAGLMVGRTPEYLGKKIQSAEVKMAVLALLVVPATILVLTSVAAVLPAGLVGLSNAGPHGFSELLYAYTSAAATNGSAFAGLSANTIFFNLTLALAMLCGRFLVIVPVLAIAGSLAAKAKVPVSPGTLPTDGIQFVLLIVGTVLILGALTFFPALALGPLAEHYSVYQLH